MWPAPRAKHKTSKAQRAEHDGEERGQEVGGLVAGEGWLRAREPKAACSVATCRKTSTCKGQGVGVRLGVNLTQDKNQGEEELSRMRGRDLQQDGGRLVCRWDACLCWEGLAS